MDASRLTAFLLVTTGAILLLLLWRLPVPVAAPPVHDAIIAVSPKSVPDMFTPTAFLLTGGSALATTNTASLAIALPPGPWIRAEVDLVGNAAQDWMIRFSRDHQALSVAATPGERADVMLPGNPMGSGELAARLTVKPPLGEEPALRKVTVQLRALSSAPAQSLPGIIALAAIPAMLVLLLLGPMRQAAKRALPAGLAAGIALVATALARPEVLEHAYWMGVALAAVLLAASFRRRDRGVLPSTPAHWELWALAVVTLLALQARWLAFTDMRDLMLRPDALGFVEIARDGSLYSTAQSHPPWVREPLFPALIRLWFLFAPEGGVSARLFGLLLGILTPAAVWIVGRKVFTPFVGLAAAAAIATNQYWAETSVSVLRLDVVTISMLGLAFAASHAAESARRGLMQFTAWGTALALLRINYFFLLIPCALYTGWRQGWKPAWWAAALGVPLLALIPHLVFNYSYEEYRDPLFSSNIHYRYYLNRDMIGKPGFPATFSEWEGNEYAGEHLSGAAFFSHYPVTEIARRFATGYVNIFMYRFPHEILFRGNEAIMAFGLIGGVLFLRRGDQWWLAGFYLVMAFPIAFIAADSIDYRLAAPMAPFLLFIWAQGVQQALLWLRQLAGQKRRELPMEPELTRSEIDGTPQT